MERILVALDGSAHSDKALDLAADLADKYQADLILVHVLSAAPLSDAERHMAAVEYADELTSRMESWRQPTSGGPMVSGHEALMRYGDLARRFRELIGERLMSAAASRLEGRHPRSIKKILEHGDPAETILKLAADHEVDAIVMGSRGVSDIKGLLMGSVSHKIAHLATCTCITVK